MKDIPFIQTFLKLFNYFGYLWLLFPIIIFWNINPSWICYKCVFLLLLWQSRFYYNNLHLQKFSFLFFCGHQKTDEHLLSTYNLKGINILNFENVSQSSRLKLLFQKLPFDLACLMPVIQLHFFMLSTSISSRLHINPIIHCN